VAPLFFGYVTGIFEGEQRDVILVDANNSITIDIPRAATTTEIADILKEEGLIEWPELYKFVSKMEGFDGTYRAGTHFVSKDNTMKEIMQILTGSPKSLSVTIPEGFSFKQIEDLLVSKKTNKS
jgi:UPF0755 protein